MLSSFALQPLANASWLPCAVPALQKLLQCIQCAKYRACVQQRHASVALDASPRPVVHATINGMHVDVPQGTSILEAARKLQITVRLPVWCKLHQPAAADCTGMNSKTATHRSQHCACIRGLWLWEIHHQALAEFALWILAMVGCSQHVQRPSLKAWMCRPTQTTCEAISNQC